MISEKDLIGGVIWITGFSAAGKTSVARNVVEELKAANIVVVHLDGDDLRGILGNTWGYSDQERRELARVYFRLCSHLSVQKVVAVISAVAMYQEIYDWFRQNVPRGIIAYLDVPEDVRRRRDAITKNVYSRSDAINTYDVPVTADITLFNNDGENLLFLARQIIEKFKESKGGGADRGKAVYWDSFYSKSEGAVHPSPFAVFVAGRLDAKKRKNKFLEVGCGNGRDSAYFANIDCSVTAMDASKEAINFCKKKHSANINFSHGTLNSNTCEPLAYDAVYSRFVLHAMTYEEQGEFLNAVVGTLKPGGKLFVECRSVNDPLARKGEILSPTERIDGHYRRFIIMEALKNEVTSRGLLIEYLIESSGLAIYGGEDPVVIRLIATKQE